MISQEDRERMIEICKAILAEEDQQKVTLLAEELRRLIENRRSVQLQ